MDAQNAVRLCIREELDDARRVAVGTSAAATESSHHDSKLTVTVHSGNAMMGVYGRGPVGLEGESALVVLDAGLLQLLLRPANPSPNNGTASPMRHIPSVHSVYKLDALSDAGDLGVGVDDAWDGIVVHVAVLPRNVLNSSDALLLGLVREHGPIDDVTDSVHIGLCGAEVAVNLNAAGAVTLDAKCLQTQAIRVRAATSGHQHLLTASDRLQGI